MSLPYLSPTALTLEQVLGKRKKVVGDMCDQLEARARQEARSDEWCVLLLTSGVVAARCRSARCDAGRRRGACDCSCD